MKQFSRRFQGVLRYLAQVVLYALFALVIGYFTTAPRYRHLAPDEGLLRLSFSHPGKPVGDCRRRTEAELAKLPPQMRGPLECPRERSPVRVRVRMDGAEIIDASFAPSGVERDGAAIGYRRIPIAAGEHRFEVQVNDDVRATGFGYSGEAKMRVAAGQVVLIDFVADKGGVVIR